MKKRNHVGRGGAPEGVGEKKALLVFFYRKKGPSLRGAMALLVAVVFVVVVLVVAVAIVVVVITNCNQW